MMTKKEARRIARVYAASILYHAPWDELSDFMTESGYSKVEKELLDIIDKISITRVNHIAKIFKTNQ